MGWETLYTDELSVPRLGVWEPIGHADYYPNGGRAQSGCQNLLIGGLYDFIYCEFSVEHTFETIHRSYRVSIPRT